MGAITLGTWALIGASAVGAGTGIAAAVKGTPKAPASPLMPDQTSVQQSQQLAEEQAAATRQGRASTILTDNSNTGDRLGP